MSPVATLTVKQNPARQATPARPDKSARLHREAEALLRELAFVYQLVRAVQQSLSESRD
jgi:hypothetical protein